MDDKILNCEKNFIRNKEKEGKGKFKQRKRRKQQTEEEKKITLEKRKKTMLEKYGVENPGQCLEVQEKRKKTMLEKYGVENASQCLEIQEKKKQTSLRNNGVGNPSQCLEIQEKKKQTLLKNYGVEYLQQSSIIRDKSKQTSLKNYGVENSTQSSIIKNRAKKTNVKKYGVEYVLQSTLVKGKSKKTRTKKYVENILPLYLQKLNVFLLSEYTGYNDILTFECKECNHIFKESLQNIYQRMYSCPNCGPNLGRSICEKEIVEFLNTLNIDCITNDRQILRPKEVDIYIPSKQVAIEFNGLYWHSEVKGKDKNYHLSKTEGCEKKNIQLIHIFEDEWMFKKEIVKSKLKQILGVNGNQQINYGDCIIKEIDSKSKNEFLEKYHIQGKDNSKVKLGVFYNDELVSVMTFSKSNINKNSKIIEDGWELNRFCSNPKYYISDIDSKLLTYFQCNYKWKEIFLYADRRWSRGHVYKKLGFELQHITKPNYWYIDGFTRIHQFNLREKENEFEDLEYISYLKEDCEHIWDCGSLLFTLT